MYNEEIKCMSVSLQDFNDDHYIQDNKCLLSYFSLRMKLNLQKNICILFYMSLYLSACVRFLASCIISRRSLVKSSALKKYII